jgi:hypothetical protein
VRVEKQTGTDRDADSTGCRPLRRANRVEPRADPHSEAVLREPLFRAGGNHASLTGGCEIPAHIRIDGNRQWNQPRRIPIERRTYPNLPGQFEPARFCLAQVTNHTTRPERAEFSQHSDVEVECPIPRPAQTVSNIEKIARAAIGDGSARVPSDVLERGTDMNP